MMRHLKTTILLAALAAGCHGTTEPSPPTDPGPDYPMSVAAEDRELLEAGADVVSAALRCGTGTAPLCPRGYVCVDDASDDCDPRLASPRACPGFCRRPLLVASCGGLTGRACAAGSECVDDPGDTCDPTRGGADCPGICRALPCGGIAGRICPVGAVCLDDPRDTCDPARGGADCPGLCRVQPCTSPEDVCPPGFRCHDDPRDSCDPRVNDGFCPGFCKPAPVAGG